jgi:hypothetical protein
MATITELHVASVYLAGPMRGLPEFNFPAFDAAALDLRARGYTVCSPAEMDKELDDFDPNVDEARSMAFYMTRDLPAVCSSDAVVVLPGWQKSQGALLETHVARACGIPVLAYPDLGPARHPGSDRFHELLEEKGLLHDRKQADYGTDGDPFANVRASTEWGVAPWVGAMVRLTDKVRRLQSLIRNGRLENESATDSLDDIAVYAIIARVLLEEELPHSGD